MPSETSDKDGDKLKFRWEFGDGKKSYLAKTSHTYEKTGVYRIILRVDDGSEQIFKEFEIKVEKYPRRDLEIIRLLPNPKGIDKGNEEIEVRNNSSKSVDLRGWKIATGSEEEKLINHPIYEKIVVKSGKKIIIKNDKCFFALPNKKGVVSLRYPDGKEADIVTYEKEKIEEGDVYILENENWIWQEAVDGEDEKSISSEEEFDFQEQVLGLDAESGYDYLKDFFVENIVENRKRCQSLSLKKIMAENWLEEERKWSYLKIF